MKLFYPLVLASLFLTFTSPAKPKSVSKKIHKSNSSARLKPSAPPSKKKHNPKENLKPVFESYNLESLQIKIQQEIFLSAIKINMKSKGNLDIKGNKFYLNLKGNPSSVLLFDGKILWYQSDASEKLVFQLKNPSHIQILTSFFNEKSFFKSFHIKQAIKTEQNYVLQLLPIKKIKDLAKVFIKTETHISEIRITWKNLSNWQKYTLSKPVSKTFPEGHFQFPTEGFQVIKKNPSF